MKRFQSKYKLDRRVGKNVLQRAKSPVVKRTNKPGMKPSNMTQNVSHFGQCLMQRQMCKRIFCIFKESQFAHIVQKAKESKNVIEALVQLLDLRLITVVYRALFSATPWAARQLVSHKKIRLNGKIVNVGNHVIQVGDVIELHESMVENSHVKAACATRERVVPDFLKVEGNKCTVIGVPAVNNPYAKELNFRMIIEGYR